MPSIGLQAIRWKIASVATGIRLLISPYPYPWWSTPLLPPVYPFRSSLGGPTSIRLSKWTYDTYEKILLLNLTLNLTLFVPHMLINKLKHIYCIIDILSTICFNNNINKSWSHEKDTWETRERTEIFTQRYPNQAEIIIISKGIHIHFFLTSLIICLRVGFLKRAFRWEVTRVAR